MMGSWMTAVKDVLEFVSSPVGVMTLSMAAGLALIAAGSRRRLGQRLVAAGSGLFLLFTLTPISELVVTLLERSYVPIVSGSNLAGVGRIVVLAGYGHEFPGIPITSSMSDDTLCRVAEGARLHRLRPEATVIVSGGVVDPGQRSIAAMMSDLMIVLGVPAADIIVEGQSTTTYENLIEVQKIIGSSQFALVAAARDLPRALAVARRLGMAAVPAPACIRTMQSYPAGMSRAEWFAAILDSFRDPSIGRLADLQWAYHEYAGYLWYRLLGRI